MKRLSRRRIAWLERHRLRSERAKLRQRAKAALRRQSVRRYRIFVETQAGRRRAWADRRIAMPENFCLEDNYEECARCLAGLRARLSESIEDYLGGDTGRGKMKRRVPSYMDFSTIKRCTPAAALVLAAEYDRARSLVPWNIYLVNLDNWRRDLAELLDEIGFFSLLGIPRPERRDKRRDVTVVPFETGDTFGNNEAGPLTAALAEMIVSADPQGIMNADIRAARLRLTLPRYCPRS